ncbi:MAG: amino acid adenylation domain-containing protein [Ginsengibacter sp.]
MQKIKTVSQKTSASSTEKGSNENLEENSVKKTIAHQNSYFNKNAPMHRKKFLISKELTQQLQAFVKNEQATLFITLLEVLNVLFYRYNPHDDICIGIRGASAPLTAEDLPMALFNGLIHVPNKLRNKRSFIELLNDIKLNVHKSSEYSGHSYTYEDELLASKGDLRLTTPSQVTLIVQTLEEDSQIQFGILQLSGEPLTLSSSKPETQFFMKETQDGIACNIEYNLQIYKDERIDQMVNHLKELLASILQSPDEEISKHNILTAAERRQLLIAFNDTKTEYPRDKTLVGLFEEQVNANPKKLAVVFENKKLTYDELNKRSNQVAWCLLRNGVKKEQLIPIFIERSVEMLIGLLGILKAGAAYVPVDTEYPADRINYMLEDTAATFIISSKKSHVKLPASATVNVIEIDNSNDVIKNMPLKNPGVLISSRDMAYVIYTSGSTGKPKGVMVEHQAIADHCFGLIEAAQLKNCTSFALFSPLVFDAGHSIIFTSLLIGAALNILSKELIMDGEKLASYLEENPVDCIKIVPSVWLSYVNNDNVILADKIMIFGGETFSPKIQEHLSKLNYNGIVYNHYGPTEATIGKCIHKVDLHKKYKKVPIGKPFSNTQLYVVDAFGQIVPFGIDGELYISGEGIARGYLNRPELTAEKFIENPFRNLNLPEVDEQNNTYNTSNAVHGSRIYKTGDKVKWNADGEIEYLGRIDDQVKINGYRIELGEIENVLLQNKDIKQAAVKLCEDGNNNKILVGYIVPRKSFDKQNTADQLKEKLPDYMIPGMWIELDQLPLTPNGKIDKKTLPLPDFAELLKKKYAPPTDEIEKALVKIWKNLLGAENIGIYDTFFELGGNSIQAVSMFNRVRKHFGKTLPIATIFQAPDISKLASIIAQNENISGLASLVPIQPNGHNAPLFCIHAGAGNILFYNDLAKSLGTGQPLYGLRAKGMNGKEHFHQTIEEMATHYIKEIRAFQPKGPYSLAGYCLGGIIAFEMAQQLTKQGQKVNLLALFNSRSPTYLEAAKNLKTERSSVGLLSVIHASTGDFSSLNSKEKIGYPVKLVKNTLTITGRFVYYGARKKYFKLNSDVMKFCFDYYLSKGRLLPRILRSRYLLHTNGHMSRAYKAEVYPGKMIIFRSPQIYKDLYLGWKKHVSGGIESCDVPGKYTNRQDIMKEPFVGVISDKLKTILK